MTAPAGWRPISVRARLLVAFSVLFLSAAVLAAVGALAMRNTGQALQNLRTQVLPEVSLSLELSQRAAAIAAIAPYVAESTLPFQLQAESLAMRSRMAEVDRLAAALPAEGTLVRDLGPLLQEIRANVEQLIDVTRRDLFLQEDAREFVYRLDSLRSELSTAEAGRPPDPFALARAEAMLRDVELATQITDPTSLERLRHGLEAQANATDRAAALPEALRNFLRSQVLGPGHLFAARDQHVKLAERKAFLVIQARAQAERLGMRVEAYVRGLRASVDADAAAVDRALHSGRIGIALLSAACVAVALLGIRIVNRTVRSLAGITRVMSRLASGDVDPAAPEKSTPEIARRDELGDLARAFEVFRENAREIRRISGHLREQSSLLETVFESMNDGLSVFDRDGRLLAWNRRYAVLLALPDDTLRRGASLQSIQALLPNRVHDGASGNATLDELNAPRQTEGRRFELAFSDGRVVEFRSSPMPGGGFVTLYSDLTERRSVEGQLRQAQKMEVLGQLTSGVAHDFNNLLAAIIGNAYLLEISPQLSPRDQRFAERVRKAAERGATLTTRLLAFARRQSLSPQALAVDTLIEDLADLIEYSLGGNIRLELALGAGAVRVWVDKAQLENALLNLVINARDAMPDGGQLRLATLADRPHGRVRIEVSDSGRGMDEATRERIFEPFFTTKGLGSGLGLSIVYGFVAQSGGDIRVDSRPGRGTTFVLSLPLTEGTEAPADSAPPPPAEPPPPQSVLLVEDDADVQSAVADLLRATGHAVTPAGSARDALAHLPGDITLVLSDVDLGGELNGAQLVREIQARHPGLPCLLMSGLPYEVLSSRFHLQEPGLLLSKPFSVRQLEDGLRRALRGAGS